MRHGSLRVSCAQPTILVHALAMHTIQFRETWPRPAAELLQTCPPLVAFFWSSSIEAEPEYGCSSSANTRLGSSHPSVHMRSAQSAAAQYPDLGQRESRC